MKSYKLVRNSEMENKAEKLGCSRTKEDLSGVFMYVIIGDEESSQYWFTNNYNGHGDYKEITQADFLALPEPIKVGDWVKINDEYMRGVFYVRAARDKVINLAGFHNDYNSDDFTKLTDEQVEVLGL